jgi:hypothetical protein
MLLMLVCVYVYVSVRVCVSVVGIKFSAVVELGTFSC